MAGDPAQRRTSRGRRRQHDPVVARGARPAPAHGGRRAQRRHRAPSVLRRYPPRSGRPVGDRPLCPGWLRRGARGRHREVVAAGLSRAPASVIFPFPSGPLAQLAEQQTLNLWVLGSIPRRLTTPDPRLHPSVKPLPNRVASRVRSCSWPNRVDCCGAAEAVCGWWLMRSTSAKVAELVYALDLGSSPFMGWGFESPLSHQLPSTGIEFVPRISRTSPSQRPSCGHCQSALPVGSGQSRHCPEPPRGTRSEVS